MKSPLNLWLALKTGRFTQNFEDNGDDGDDGGDDGSGDDDDGGGDDNGYDSERRGFGLRTY